MKNFITYLFCNFPIFLIRILLPLKNNLFYQKRLSNSVSPIIQKEKAFFSLRIGPSIYSCDTLGKGVFLSSGLHERIHKNWFIGLEFEEYFRKKGGIPRVLIPEAKIIENWLRISSGSVILSWGNMYPRVMMKTGICYIYGTQIIMMLSPNLYINKIKKFSGLFEISLSETLWILKTPLGITIEASSGVLFLRKFYGKIGIGINYKPGRLK